MAGTRAGSMKAKQTVYERYGKDFYREIGRIGGRNGHTGGFASNPELAREAGRKGGRVSRRGPARPIIESTQESVMGEGEPGNNADN